MLAPEIMNQFGQTWEEVREEVDRELYGITADPLVPYPWEKPPTEMPTFEERAPVVEVVLIAA